MPHAEELKIALIQTDIAWEDVNINLMRMSEHLEAVHDVDLIVLPEMFNTGFTMRAQDLAEPMDGQSMHWLQKTAQAKRAVLVASLAIREHGSCFNRLVWVYPGGQIHTYDKRHLFAYAQESAHYCAGNRHLVVDYRGWRISTFICYDLRFPMWSRNMHGHYDVALYVANWPDRRSHHWKTLLPARAIENQSYVIGLNRVGSDGNGLSYGGGSMVVDPLGEVLYQGRREEDVQILRLFLQHVHRTREQLPFLKDADSVDDLAPCWR